MQNTHTWLDTHTNLHPHPHPLTHTHKDSNTLTLTHLQALTLSVFLTNFHTTTPHEMNFSNNVSVSSQKDPLMQSYQTCTSFPMPWEPCSSPSRQVQSAMPSLGLAPSSLRSGSVDGVSAGLHRLNVSQSHSWITHKCNRALTRTHWSLHHVQTKMTLLPSLLIIQQPHRPRDYVSVTALLFCPFWVKDAKVKSQCTDTFINNSLICCVCLCGSLFWTWTFVSYWLGIVQLNCYLVLKKFIAPKNIEFAKHNRHRSSGTRSPWTSLPDGQEEG